MPEISISATRSSSLSLGAAPESEGTRFRVWAPAAKRVEVVFESCRPSADLNPDNDGYFSALVPGAKPGDLYRFRLNGGDSYPDPASRYQPHGPHGPSQIIDPSAYEWSAGEADWPGVAIAGQVLYELHVGTFTPEGTYSAALREFPRLRDLGITVLECMPLAEFAGEVGWGYDGVNLFAPFHRYGTPDDLRRMIDAAHQHGLGVILDVVYNHLGPDGNYLPKFSPYYFSRADTEWGNAINFDGKHSLPVREFYCSNAAHWIEEFHFDGLRLDATQSICDNGAHGQHIIAEVGRAARKAANGRKTIIVAENEPQDCRLICPLERDGYGLDGVWNDDFHHSAVVALTERREAYFSDHLGKPQEFISAAKYGYLFQGQFYSWQNQPRGTSSLDFEPKAFVTFLENHDQIANFGTSLRVRQLSSPARYRAMTALWLLSPGTPMFFQGQEYGAETPFHYFAAHQAELGRKVSEGRREFMKQFGSQDTREMQARFPDPGDRETFARSHLDPAEQAQHPEIVQLHRDLLALRRDDPLLSASFKIDGAVIGDSCFVLRFMTEEHTEDRLLVVNLGTGLDLPHLPEPLVAPPAGCDWQMHWCSEAPAYGGCGASLPGRFGAWQVEGECTQLLVPVSGSHGQPETPKSGV